MPRIYSFITAFLCLAGLVAAMTIVLREAGIYFKPFDTSPEFADYMVETGGNFGSSLFSKQAVLLDCSYSMTTGLNDPLVQAAGKEITAECRRTSEEILRSTPSYGLAWYVRAVSAASAGDMETFRHSLSTSQIAAPREQWLAQSRMNIGELFISAFDATDLDRHNADIALMVSSPGHINDVARRYQQDASSRERIMQIVSTLPPSTQSAFIRAVRNAINNAGLQPS